MSTITLAGNAAVGMEKTACQVQIGELRESIAALQGTILTVQVALASATADLERRIAVVEARLG